MPDTYGVNLITTEPESEQHSTYSVSSSLKSFHSLNSGSHILWEIRPRHSLEKDHFSIYIVRTRM